MKFSLTYPLISTFLRAIQNSDPICLIFEGASIFQKFTNLNKFIKKTVSMRKWQNRACEQNQHAFENRITACKILSDASPSNALRPAVAYKTFKVQFFRNLRDSKFTNKYAQCI